MTSTVPRAAGAVQRLWNDRRRRRWLKLAMALVGALLAVRVALPSGLGWLIERQASQALGSDVWVGDVDLWLLRGAFAVERFGVVRQPAEERDRSRDATLARLDLGATNAGEKPPLAERLAALPPPGEEAFSFGLGRLYVDLAWTALLDGELRVSALELDGAGAILELHGDGSLVWPGLRRAPEPEEEPAMDEASGPGWPVRVDRIALRNSGVRVQATFEGAPQALDLLVGELAFEDLTFAEGQARLGAVKLDEIAANVRPHHFARGEAGDEPTGTPATADLEAASTTPAAAPPLASGHRVDRIAIEHASFTLLVGESEPVEVSLRLVATEFSIDPGETFPVELDLGISDGSLRLRGMAGVAPPAFEGRIEWTALPLSVLAAIADPENGAWVRTGRSDGGFDVDARLVGAETGATRLVRASGRVDASGLSFVDPSGAARALAWERLAIELDEFVLPLPSLGVPRVALSKVELEAPRAAWLIEAPPDAESPARDEADDAEAAGAGDEAEPIAAETQEASDGAPIELVLAAFALHDGEIALVDRTQAPVYRNQLSQLELQATDLRYPDLSLGRFELGARSAEGGRIALAGSLQGDAGELHVTLEEIALPPLNPYVAGQVPYHFPQGALSLTTDVAKKGDRYPVRNVITLHDLRVDEHELGDFKSRFGVPLDLALALLRGPGGDIALRLDFEVARDEVEVGMGGIVASALRQAFIGALSSPLKMVGSVLPKGDGAGGLSLDVIAFEPGTSRLSAEGAEQVDGLAKLLTSRPALALELSGATDAADREALARADVLAAAREGDDLPEVSDDGGFFARRSARKALAARAEGEAFDATPDDEALIQRWIVAAEERLPPARLDALARERVVTVQGIMLEKHRIPQERLRTGPATTGNVAGVAIGLGT